MKNLLLLLVLTLTASVIAVDAWSAPKDKAEIRTLTGCLAQGDEATEFLLTAGSKWELTSKTVSLAPHLGHTVAVTGAVSHAQLPAKSLHRNGQAMCAVSFRSLGPKS